MVDIKIKLNNEWKEREWSRDIKNVGCNHVNRGIPLKVLKIPILLTSSRHWIRIQDLIHINPLL